MTEITRIVVPVISIGHLTQEISQILTERRDNNPWCPCAEWAYGFFLYLDEPEAWQHICDSFREMQAAALIANDPLQIQHESELPAAPYVSEDEIYFNGIGSDACESMVLQRLWAGFNCCKTRRRPYDRAVIAVLCLANYFAPTVWEISSDGDEDDWQDGLALARTVVPQCPMPTFRY